MKRKGFTLVEMLTVIAIIVILAGILYPVFASAKKKAQCTTCQNNITQIAKALKSYLADWEDMYPTNRSAAGNVLAPDVPLSARDAQGNPQIFQYGVNWVEGIYKYIEPVREKPGEETVWVCPLASEMILGIQTAANTYALNMNMLEQTESAFKSPATTMLLREMDRRCGAVCRPQNVCNSPLTPPKYAFLTTIDEASGGNFATNAQLHGVGSNIVFADTHVKKMPPGDMPLDNLLQWDDATKQWRNPQGTIAITP